MAHFGSFFDQLHLLSGHFGRYDPWAPQKHSQKANWFSPKWVGTWDNRENVSFWGSFFGLGRHQDAWYWAGFWGVHAWAEARTQGPRRARSLLVVGPFPSPVRTPTLTPLSALFPLSSSPAFFNLKVFWLSRECPLLAKVINCQSRGLLGPGRFINFSQFTVQNWSISPHRVPSSGKFRNYFFKNIRFETWFNLHLSDCKKKKMAVFGGLFDRNRA